MPLAHLPAFVRRLRLRRPSFHRSPSLGIFFFFPFVSFFCLSAAACCFFPTGGGGGAPASTASLSQFDCGPSGILPISLPGGSAPSTAPSGLSTYSAVGILFKLLAVPVLCCVDRPRLVIVAKDQEECHLLGPWSSAYSFCVPVWCLLAGPRWPSLLGFCKFHRV